MVKIANIELPNQPIILAPMEDVTDICFRLLCKEYGADLMYSEFISSEGLIREAYISGMKTSFDESERPFGIQLFGNNVDSMVRAAKVAEALNPDIIDINFGCPVKKIVFKNQGSALLKDIPLLLAITKAVVESTSLPVTVKTRLGWDETNKPIVELAEALQDIGVKALTVHGRTRSQMYNGEADWTLIGEIKNNQRMQIPIIGNGDIKNPQDAKNAFDRYGVDGVMIGRASIGNPRLFKEVKHYLATGELLPACSIEEKVDVCKKLIVNTVDFKGERRAIQELKKHYTNFFKAIPNFKPFKLQLMAAQSKEELFEVLTSIKMSSL